MKDMRVPMVRCVLPQAPSSFVTIVNLSAPVWYDVVPADFIATPWNTGEILAAAENVNDLIEIQPKICGIKPARSLIAGFSQGGSAAATVYLRYKLAAAILVASFLTAWPGSFHRTSDSLYTI